MDQSFDIWAYRFQGGVRLETNSLRVEANSLRGRFGAELRRIDRDAYERFFEPRQVTGPSGLRNAPRPFVFRTIRQGFGMNFFLEPPQAALKACRAVEPTLTEEHERLSLPLSFFCNATRIRICFLTPTELKGFAGANARPEFPILMGRLRDRISTLRAIYQDGPLEIDFKALGERAARIAMTRCEIRHVDAERTSRNTGQTHSLGGFTGVAEYEGELGEFLPYLEIGRWTGIGRQTVWGKGEIAVETF